MKQTSFMIANQNLVWKNFTNGFSCYSFNPCALNPFSANVTKASIVAL